MQNQATINKILELFNETTPKERKIQLIYQLGQVEGIDIRLLIPMLKYLKPNVFD